MRLKKKSFETGANAILILLILLAALIIILLIIGQSRGFMTYYLDKIFS